MVWRNLNFSLVIGFICFIFVFSHLSGENSRMTDVDREQIDKEAQSIIQRCRDNLNNVKKTGNCNISS